VLQRLGVQITAEDSLFPEETVERGTTAELVQALAEEKAKAVAASHPEALVVGADNLVDVDGERLGKPQDADDAKRMLTAIQGRSHTAYHGLAVVHAQAERLQSIVVPTTVRFRSMTADDIAWYLETGEPLGKAGAYAIQGYGSLFIDQIEGDFNAVAGMSAHALHALLVQCDSSLTTYVQHEK